jgi:inositol hexakisphosphate/diphosphoinositol-pentakisphosphate kinase
VLIAFYSTDFPLKKAMDYVQLRKPICVNDVAMQELLFDRRIVGSLLDHLEVPTPRRLEASRDGGPKVAETLRQLVLEKQGLDINEARPMADVRVREDGDAIIVNGQVMEKPFVEKPVDGEDHNIWIYFKGGGGRKLFRKVSSTFRNRPISNGHTGWKQI